MLRRPVLYPRTYGLYVTLASLDVLLTWLILSMGGTELNQIAAWVFDQHGVAGATFFKFTTVLVVLLTCEFLGHRPPEARIARRLAHLAVAISVIPVMVGVIELSDARVWEGPLAMQGESRVLFAGHMDAARSE